jgi:hypothetical protein
LPPYADAAAAYTSKFELKGCIDTEARLGDDKIFFGYRVPIHYTTAAAFAAGAGGQGAYFAVAYDKTEKNGIGFLFNSTTGQGLTYNGAVGCSLPCLDNVPNGVNRVCGRDERPSGGIAWAVYAPPKKNTTTTSELAVG